MTTWTRGIGAFLCSVSAMLWIFALAFRPNPPGVYWFNAVAWTIVAAIAIRNWIRSP